MKTVGQFKTELVKLQRRTDEIDAAIRDIRSQYALTDDHDEMVAIRVRLQRAYDDRSAIISAFSDVAHSLAASLVKE